MPLYNKIRNLKRKLSQANQPEVPQKKTKSKPLPASDPPRGSRKGTRPQGSQPQGSSDDVTSSRSRSTGPLSEDVTSSRSRSTGPSSKDVTSSRSRPKGSSSQDVICSPSRGPSLQDLHVTQPTKWDVFDATKTSQRTFKHTLVPVTPRLPRAVDCHVNVSHVPNVPNVVNVSNVPIVHNMSVATNVVAPTSPQNVTLTPNVSTPNQDEGMPTFPELLEEFDRMTYATPEMQARQVMMSDNISPSEAPGTLLELSALNTLALQVAQAPKTTKKKIFSRTKAKKYRGYGSILGRKVGVNRHYVSRPKKVPERHRRKKYQERKSFAVKFMKREDNSMMLPSKKDALKGGKNNYALSDTLKNLYNKCRLEFPEETMSFATFAKQRPKNVKCIKWAARRQCLCVKHQNAALKLKAIKVKSTPTLFIRENTAEDIQRILKKLPKNSLNFNVWRIDEIKSKDRTIKKLRLHDDKLSRKNFCEVFTEEFEVFRDHCSRITAQYSQLKLLRESLSPGCEVTVQMDYSENYQCVYQDEPSAIFFDRNLITIHPAVVHYQQDSNLKHKSFVFITDVTSHAASTTLAFISALVPRIRKLLPELNVIHYISDSPSSQYRNKSIVKVIAEHAAMFGGVTATWEYLEAGHGKGPCDGIGGTIKKQAEIAVKRGVIIKNSADFGSWASKEEKNMTVVEVFRQDITRAENKLQNATFVKGISTAHSIRPHDGKIYIRETSCYECCRQQINVSHGWKKTNISTLVPQATVTVPVSTAPAIPTVSTVPTVPTVPTVSTVPTVPTVPTVSTVSTGSRRQSQRLMSFSRVASAKRNLSTLSTDSTSHSGRTRQSVASGGVSSASVTVNMQYKMFDFIAFRYRRTYWAGQIVTVDCIKKSYLVNVMVDRPSGKYAFPAKKIEYWIPRNNVIGYFDPTS